jgi:hypothetical protein
MVNTAAKLYNADAKGKFQAGDNLTIISAGFSMPESYTQWKNRADLIALPLEPSAKCFIDILGDGLKKHFSYEEKSAAVNIRRASDEEYITRP